MHSQIQTQLTMVVGTILAIIAVIFGLTVFFASNQQMTMNQAVSTALYDSRDDDAQVSRGVYAVNISRFDNDLEPKKDGQQIFAAARKRYNRNYSNVQFHPHYLEAPLFNANGYPSDAGRYIYFENNAGSKNIHPSTATITKYLKKYQKSPSNHNGKYYGSNFIPIKAVKVIVTGDTPNKKNQTIDIATFVVSSNVTMANHNEDATGDNVSNKQLPQDVIQ